MRDWLTHSGAPGVRAEERGAKLEESRVGLVASLDLLVKGVTIWSYVHHHRHCLRPLAAIKQPAREEVTLMIEWMVSRVWSDYVAQMDDDLE